MGNCGQNNRNCGCADQPYKTPINCGASPCAREECPEIFDMNCIVYTGDRLVAFEGGFTIENGMRLTEIFQKLMLALGSENPCVGLNSQCKIPLNFRTTNIFSTSVHLTWNVVPSAIGYQVMYKKIDDNNWTVGATVNQSLTPNCSIVGLLPNTEYLFKVISTCGQVSCESVIIYVKTLE